MIINIIIVIIVLISCRKFGDCVVALAIWLTSYRVKQLDTKQGKQYIRWSG